MPFLGAYKQLYSTLRLQARQARLLKIRIYACSLLKCLYPVLALASGHASPCTREYSHHARMRALIEYHTCYSRMLKHYLYFARTHQTTRVYPCDNSRVFFNLPTDGTVFEQLRAYIISSANDKYCNNNHTCTHRIPSGPMSIYFIYIVQTFVLAVSRIQCVWKQSNAFDVFTFILPVSSQASLLIQTGREEHDHHIVHV